MGPSSRVPSITLCQEHVPIIRGAAVVPQPSDRLRHAILTLREAEVPTTLRHTLHPTRPSNPERPTRTRQPGQNRIPVTRIVTHRRPALLQHHRLVLFPDEALVVVLHEAPLQLHRAAARLRAQVAGAGDRGGDAGGAVRHGEVAAALVEAVDDVVGGGAADDGEVVVGGVGG